MIWTRIGNTYINKTRINKTYINKTCINKTCIDATRAARRSQLVMLLALLSSHLWGAAQAQDWPARTIGMVVPYAAGGPVDTVGRIMAAGLSESLHQQVIIENISGAGGMTGTSRAAKAPADGYTFFCSADYRCSASCRTCTGNRLTTPWLILLRCHFSRIPRAS
jgi:hypothetical protein